MVVIHGELKKIMGIITKVNDNEGRHIIGWQCDLCQCIYLSEDSVRVKHDKMYCFDCYEDTHRLCVNCHKMSHIDNLYHGRCEDCDIKK